jgi:hypothetical protein
MNRAMHRSSLIPACQITRGPSSRIDWLSPNEEEADESPKPSDGLHLMILANHGFHRCFLTQYVCDARFGCLYTKGTLFHAGTGGSSPQEKAGASHPIIATSPY